LKLQIEQIGEIEVNEKDIINIEEGILGFSELSRYAIIPLGDETPLNWLQCIDKPDLAFIVSDPVYFFQDYAPDISAEDVNRLNISKPEDVLIYTIITIPENPQDMTANLVAPIVINKNTKVARQVIVQNADYSTKHRLFPSLRHSEGAEATEESQC